MAFQSLHDRALPAANVSGLPSVKQAKAILPQGLCTCSSLCQKHSSPAFFMTSSAFRSHPKCHLFREALPSHLIQKATSLVPFDITLFIST